VRHRRSWGGVISPFAQTFPLRQTPDLRGGGEYGQAWPEADRRTAKQNVFDDFCPCARWLASSGWSSHYSAGAARPPQMSASLRPRPLAGRWRWGDGGIDEKTAGRETHSGSPGEGTDMKTATGLMLIALGAILAFAVNGHPTWLNIQVVGWVIMLTGGAGMMIPAAGYAAVRRRVVRRRISTDGPVTEVFERRYPPYIKLNPAGLAAAEDPADLVASREEEAADGADNVDEYLDQG